MGAWAEGTLEVVVECTARLFHHGTGVCVCVGWAERSGVTWTLLLTDRDLRGDNEDVTWQREHATHDNCWCDN